MGSLPLSVGALPLLLALSRGVSAAVLLDGSGPGPAILLFTTDSEAVKRIHQVSCRLDDLPPIK